jgi:hypothetical protein
VRFPTIKPTPDIVAQFDTFRAPAGLGMMALRTARQIVELQQGVLASTEDAGAGTREIALSFTRGTDTQDDAGASVPQANGNASPAAHARHRTDDDLLASTQSRAAHDLFGSA